MYIQSDDEHALIKAYRALKMLTTVMCIGHVNDEQTLNMLTTNMHSRQYNDNIHGACAHEIISRTCHGKHTFIHHIIVL